MNNLPDLAKFWIKKHLLVVIFALLVGVLSVLPHLLAQHALGDAYQGIPFMYEDNEDYYLARIQEIVDGHYFVSSPHAFEYKDALPLIPPIGEYFYIILSVITFTSLPVTLMIAKFLFPALLFFLVYNFVRLVSGKTEGENIYGGIAAATFVVLAVDLVDYHSVFARLRESVPPWAILSVWTRPVNPITGALILFTYLPLLWMSFKKPGWAYPLSAGLVLALSVGYIFTWGIGFAVLSVFCAFVLAFKKYDALKRLMSIAAIALFVDGLYWVQIFPSMTMGNTAAERNGMIFTHAPLWNKVLIASLLVFSLLLVYAYCAKHINIRRDIETYAPVWFALALLLGSFAALNQQIFTGRTIWPYHIVQYSIPLAAVALVITFFALLRPEFPRIWKSIMGIVIISSVTFATANAATYIYGMKEFHNAQRMAPVFAWLNANASKDCVVLVTEGGLDLLNNYIPGFTGCDPYLASYMNNANVVPHKRIEHNFFVELRMRGVTDATFKDFYENNDDMEKTYFFKDWPEIFSPQKSERIAAMLPELSGKYREFMKMDLEMALKKYRINYIITQGVLTAEARAIPGLSEVYRTGSTTIYKLPN